MYAIAYSRDQLLSLRWAQPPSAPSSRVRLINIPITTRVRKRGCRGGRRHRLSAPTYTVIEGTGCSVISGNRPAHPSVIHRPQTPTSSTRALRVLSNVPPPRVLALDGDRRCRCLVYPPRVRLGDTDASAVGVSAPPNLYILNANSIAKPYALDQLSVELVNYNVDVAIITETHLKKRHQSSMIKIDGYNI